MSTYRNAMMMAAEYAGQTRDPYEMAVRLRYLERLLRDIRSGVYGTPRQNVVDAITRTLGSSA